MLPTFRLFIISLAFFTGLSACATPRAERVAGKSALDIRFKKSEEAVSYWRKERYWKFRTDESSLIREISLLQNHPGWPDMEKQREDIDNKHERKEYSRMYGKSKKRYITID